MKWLFPAVVLCCLSVHCSALEGELHQNIILPCSFHPGEEVVIHWTVDNSKQVVHSYYTGEDRLNKQNINYRGRTSLFLDKIKNGNASLKLMKLQKSDEKTYSCYVGTIAGGGTQATWPLTVRAPIWSEQHRNVTLPCNFIPSNDLVIHWKIRNEQSQTVHSYFDGADQFNNQDKAYTGRTQLFLSELNKGNASLQIRNLQQSDANTYSCYISTSKGPKEDSVKLHVADFEHTMEFTPENSRLKCCANIYPSDAATIEWAENGKRTPLPPNKCASHTLIDTSQSFNCTIRHSIVESTWRGNWEKKVSKEDSITCECRSCKAVNNEFSSKFYLINNTVEVPVASINDFKNSGPSIAEDYEDRVRMIPEEYSLSLTNLTTKDNGEYICVIKTIDEMHITVTTVNITTLENPLTRHHWILLGVLGFNFIVILFILLYLFKKNNRKASLQAAEYSLEQCGSSASFI
ncbi:HERV-H LTR-associating protein 2 [Hyperolius riggenbachi]|uniref:HERV-H LTR-associating protein 2 n=1 Tax=Hyperolius riggenbachi TaxID=752182 RepID=UPI0035A35465